MSRKKATPKAAKALTIHVVLDRSGSMEWCKSQAITGFNEYVAKVAKDAPGSRLSLTLFGGSDLILRVDNQPIDQVQPLTEKTFQPFGGTPLYDTIGHVIGELDNISGHKALVILTDGEENMSTKFTAAQIKDILADRQKEEDLLVIYLGANQDAFHEGQKFGTKMGTTMNYSPQNMAATMAASAAATLRYAATGHTADATFTVDERKLAAGEKQ